MRSNIVFKAAQKCGHLQDECQLHDLISMCQEVDMTCYHAGANNCLSTHWAP